MWLFGRQPAPVAKPSLVGAVGGGRGGRIRAWGAAEEGRGAEVRPYRRGPSRRVAAAPRGRRLEAHHGEHTRLRVELLGENGVLWVSSAVNFPVVCSCLRVALACTPKLERHHAERALRRSRDLLGQEPTSPSLRAPNDMGKSAPKRASDADQDVRPAEAKDGSGPEPPPSGAGGGTDGAPAAPPAPVDSAEELRVLRKRLERLEAQAAQPVAPDGEDLRNWEFTLCRA